MKTKQIKKEWCSKHQLNHGHKYPSCTPQQPVESKGESLKEFRNLLNDKNRISDNIRVYIDGNELYLNAQDIMNILDSLIELQCGESKGWEELDNQINNIFDRHTKALTKTTDNDGTEIVSFDTVLVDIYEVKKELWDLFSQQRIQERERIIEFLEKNGHGGGNWRRLLSTLKEEYE